MGDTKILVRRIVIHLFVQENMLVQVHGLNLEIPVSFRGLDPNLPVRRYQRHLPHWRQPGATYFVTFRLADSIPQQQLQALKRWREHWQASHPEPRSEEDWHAFAKEITTRTERYLDDGYGECVFRNMKCAQEMAKSLCYFQDESSNSDKSTALEGHRTELTALECHPAEQPNIHRSERCFTSCYCVMHNHVHAVMKPMDGFELEEILDSIKGFVSRKVNALLGRLGKLWEQESYDRIIRDEEHLYRVIQYIGNNPAKAGYPKDDWVRWIHPAWDKQSWGFRD